MSVRLIANGLLAKTMANGLPNLRLGATIHTTARLCKVEDKRAMFRSLPKKDEGTQGEHTIGIDTVKLRCVG